MERVGPRRPPSGPWPCRAAPRAQGACHCSSGPARNEGPHPGRACPGWADFQGEFCWGGGPSRIFGGEPHCFKVGRSDEGGSVQVGELFLPLSPPLFFLLLAHVCLRGEQTDADVLTSSVWFSWTGQISRTHTALPPPGLPAQSPSHSQAARESSLGGAGIASTKFPMRGPQQIPSKPLFPFRPLARYLPCRPVHGGKCCTTPIGIRS